MSLNGFEYLSRHFIVKTLVKDFSEKWQKKPGKASHETLLNIVCDSISQHSIYCVKEDSYIPYLGICKSGNAFTVCFAVQFHCETYFFTDSFDCSNGL